ncbi:MAG: ferritin family protein [Actinobacteria bacterium]|nr:ferritin family protein [Actinomycetota bacterium]
MNNKAFKDILDYAIEKEIEAASFYEATSDLAESPNVKQMFKEMSFMELGHKQKLEQITEKDVEERKIEDIRDLKISDYMIEEDFKPDMDYQEVLILAMKREEKAHQLYSDLAEKTSDSEIKKLFQLLAQEEAKHKLGIETEYDANVLKED